MLVQKIRDVAKGELENTVAFRRALHAHPEVSFHEEHTFAYLKEQLESAGVPYRQCAQYGLVARVRGTQPGPCIAFRADFDALPILEESGVEFASQQPGVMHACGHDSHAAMLLSLARTMWQNRGLVRGEAVFIFQYAEELPPGGAAPMIADGCLEGVDKIYGLHVSDELDAGVVGICYGKYMAASDGYFVDVTGAGGHGSRPSEMQDTVSAAVEAIQLSNNIVSRFISPSNFAVISTCLIEGGHTYNVLPTVVHYEGTVRTYEPGIAQQISEKLELAVKCACEMYGTNYKFKFDRGYPAVCNHDAPCAVVEEAARRLEHTCLRIQPTPVGEDFSRYLERVPGAFFRLGIRNPALEAVYPLHHCRFRIDETAMATGLEMFWTIYLLETEQL